MYVFTTTSIPAGAYEAKVAINESWGLNYGLDGARDGANIPFVVEEEGTVTEFTFDSASNIMTISVGGEAGPAVGSLFLSQAHWVSANTIAWNIGRIPGASYRLYYALDGGLDLTNDGIQNGEYVELVPSREGLSDDIQAKFPALARFNAYQIADADLALVPDILRGQIAVSATTAQGELLDATGVQIPGVLDDMYATDAPLGVTWSDGVPTLSVWAPTARSVRLHLFDDAAADTEATIFDMAYDSETGVWSVTGEADWNYKFYLYEVVVYAPSTRQVETNLVTDPYSFSLSTNSERSQIVDLNDAALMPEGWLDYSKPELDAFEDIVLYELHIRDFSIYDQSVPEELRGTYLAFTQADSFGMQHLARLADAGLTHVHLLPAFDIATTNEIRAEQQNPDPVALAAFPPDSEEQQALVGATRDRDGFNWGYDPFHYTAPEGSYSTDPNGAQRILEFRQMVMALNQTGLRVVMDVVYNHTNAAGQGDNSVLDRIVPGYYHRLNAQGGVETSTCCSNTATEHVMMERLMLDSLVTWSTMYKVDGYRFDLMGHHMLDNMVHVRETLDSLTVESDGVDGSMIYVYGEGWNFGEVADNARGVNATQLNLGGTGIGSFNDRIRDSVRGGSPFGGLQEQGFVNGLYTNPSEDETRPVEEQLDLLLLFQDRIRVGLAGNLRDYTFEGADGTVITGADVDYNGAPTGYTLDPQEHIVYASAHDNEALFDIIQIKAPLTTSMEDRVRMNSLSIDVVMLSQGVPFFHAGEELLRSKSGDKNSYDSGDWFNLLDFSYQDNGWGHGLPPAWTTQENWEQWQPLLANPTLDPTSEHIQSSVTHFTEMLQIRQSSVLFRLRTAEDIVSRVTFQNTGVDQIPGLIVMSISDLEGENLDPVYGYVVVLFNASNQTQTFTLDGVANYPLALHPVQAASADPIVQTAGFDAATGTFTVPALTTAVFVATDADLQ
ncbi:MAG: pullulanase-type alpha-1,6-glucosidase [Anaerolinea sp.]|nr:pullulanase-type alpha-1,6-glucosidase [Anaerolinea sp.]